MALDKKKTLYLADSCLSQVEEYSKGSTTLKTTITDGISFPLGVAIDKNNTLYVSSTRRRDSRIRQRQHVADQDGNRHVEALRDLTRLQRQPVHPRLRLRLRLGAARGRLERDQLGSARSYGAASKCGRPEDGLSLGDRRRGRPGPIYKLGSTSPVETIAGQGFPYSVGVQNQGKPEANGLRRQGTATCTSSNRTRTRRSQPSPMLATRRVRCSPSHNQKHSSTRML